MPRKRSQQKIARDKCDKIFSKIVRSIGYCERCAKTAEETQLHCSHWLPREHVRVRTDFDNAFSLCVGCHLYWWHKDVSAAHEWAIEMRGEATYRRLREIAHDYGGQRMDWLEELERLREIAKREEVTI